MLAPTVYPPAIAQLLSVRPVTPLGPGNPVSRVREQLAAIDDAALGHVVDRDMAACCRAGLWLGFSFLDLSHKISQDIATREGCYWHALMHRREPDAWNSNYWWQRVGAHPVLAQLRERAGEIGYSFTTPEAFVNFCERVRDTNGAEEQLAKRVQHLEWELLFSWCFEHAVGS